MTYKIALDTYERRAFEAETHTRDFEALYGVRAQATREARLDATLAKVNLRTARQAAR